MKRNILWAVVLIFVASLLNSSVAEPTSEVIDQHPGIKAPDFALNDLDGNLVKLSDFNGKVVILDFWATWCPPCRKEIPHFIELENEFKDKGLAIIGVSVDQGGVEIVKTFVEQTPGMDYPVLWLDQRNSSEAQVSQTYQNLLSPSERGGIPFTYIIDKDGYVRKHFVGYRDKEVFLKMITPLLAEGKTQSGK